MTKSILYKIRFAEKRSFYKIGVYKCDVCDKVFTEKRNLLRHGKKKVTHVSYVIKFIGKQRFCVDIKQVHNLNQLKCNVQNVRKRLREQTI